MEATGVYWVVLYDVLNEAGFDVWLVDGRQTKQVPGRKTDVKDCQWIQQLHSYGLLNRCYVVTGGIKELRGYQRLREDHTRNSSMHIQHMQKALTEMNVRLTEVLSQIHGSSGLKIIEAILSGERDRYKLLDLCHKRIKDNTQLKNRKPIRHNKPEVENLSEYMLRIFGSQDATQLSGISDYSWLQLLSELGTDLSKWPTEKHLGSWLGLAPGQNNSGKRKKRLTKLANELGMKVEPAEN